MCNTKYDEIIKNVLNEYNAFFSVHQSYDYDWCVTDNLYEASKSYCTEPNELDDLFAAKPTLDKANGNLVPANTNDKVYHIILRDTLFTDPSRASAYIMTIAHEYTHVIDHVEWGALHHLSDMRAGNFFGYTFMKFYTELRASYRGSLIYNHCTKIDIDFLVEELLGRVSESYRCCFNNGFDYYFFPRLYGQYLAAEKYSGKTLKLPDFMNPKGLDSLEPIIDSNKDNPLITDNWESLFAIIEYVVGINR